MNLREVTTDPSGLSLAFRETWNYCKNVLGLSPHTFEINPDGSVSVKKEGTPLRIADSYLPIRFHHVDGHFFFIHHNLKTINGSPKHVSGNFSCSSTQVTTLFGGPEFVGGDYIFRNTNVSSFEGCARHVGGILDGAKCPKMKDLKNIQKYVNTIGQELRISSSVRSTILGVLLIKNFTGEVKYEFDVVHGSRDSVTNIINKYLHNANKDVHACQQEMIDAGFAEYARI